MLWNTLINKRFLRKSNNFENWHIFLWIKLQVNQNKDKIVSLMIFRKASL